MAEDLEIVMSSADLCSFKRIAHFLKHNNCFFILIKDMCLKVLYY